MLRTVQSRVRAMAIVLSRLAESSLPGFGKERLVTVLAWWSKLPSSRFAVVPFEEDVFAMNGRGAGVGVELVAGAVEEMW